MEDSQRNDVMEDSQRRFTYFAIAIAAAFIVTLGMRATAEILNPILMAGLITMAIIPFPKYLMKRGWNPTLALIAALVLLLSIAGAIISLTWVSVNQMSTSISGSAPTSELSGEAVDSEITKILNMLTNRIEDFFTNGDLTPLLTAISDVVFSGIGRAVTVVMFIVFMLSTGLTMPVGKQMERIAGKKRAEAYAGLTQDVQKYLSITTVINALVGLLNTIFLLIVGVPYAILWGILSWVLGYIPIIGFWGAMIPPVLLAWARSGFTMAVVVVIAYIVINGTAENLIKPNMMGEGFNMSPLVIFLALAYWGWVLGTPGAILAVPLTLITMNIFGSFEATKWITILAQDKPTEELEETEKNGGRKAAKTDS
ncbi:MAG: AI-2E family transporter [Caldilineaceae bacterium]|nr:AI-2E family transporter [Caldilineaceae bacterium]